MIEFIHAFQGEMTKPGLFSLFHIISLIIIIIITIIISYKFKNCNSKTYKIILFIAWLICLIFEIMKQLVLSLHYGENSYFEYDFYHLPFHLCSSIYYIVPLILLINKDKHPSIVTALEIYMCTFVLLGGMIVIIYNDLVMSNLIYTNIQTMVHHGMQVIIGVFIFVWNRNKFILKDFIKSIPVILLFIAIAIIIDVIIFKSGHEIDMFYVNPYQISAIPILYLIQEKLGYIVYLITYTILLILGSFIVYLIQVLITNKVNKSLT